MPIMCAWNKSKYSTIQDAIKAKAIHYIADIPSYLQYSDVMLKVDEFYQAMQFIGKEKEAMLCACEMGYVTHIYDANPPCRGVWLESTPPLFTGFINK